MPAITSGTVLVTGATGYIGQHVVRTLLDNGFSVRAVVRSAAKGDNLIALYPDSTKVTYTVVSDMTAAGAYDEAVRGVDGVIHLASPVDEIITNPDATGLIEVAVNGVTRLLESVTKTGTNVKRVVDVSSIAAVIEGQGPATLNEESWDTSSSTLLAQLGDKAPGFVKYRASKTYAERAFWEFMGKDGLKFDGVVVLPGSVLGAPLKVEPGQGLSGSLAIFAAPWILPGATLESLKSQQHGVVHVKDVAKGMVLALQKPDAAGERILVAGPAVFGNDIALLAKTMIDDPAITPGDPALKDELAKTAVNLDVSKSKKILGMEYIPVEEVLRESVETVQLMTRKV